MSNIYIFGGGKGGVGKTTAALAFYHSQITAGRRFAVMEGDATNPDVARALDLGEENLFNPAEIEEWSEILELAKHTDVIVNLPGGGDRLLLENAPAIAEAAASDGNQVIFLAALNRSKECVFLLKENAEKLAGSGISIVAIINEFWGEASKFSRFNGSKMRKALAEQGGREVVLPDLHEDPLDRMLSHGGKDLEAAPPLMKSLYKSWLAKVTQAFAGI